MNPLEYLPSSTVKLVPSIYYAPITNGVDPREYVKLGRNFQRGDARRALSRSDLMAINECPHKWFIGTPEENADYMDWGTLVDCIALTPELFERQYAITPETYPATPKKKGDPVEQKPWNWNANYCGEWRAQKVTEGFLIAKPDTASSAQLAASRLREDKRINALINESTKQVQVVADYHDEATGITVPLKGCLDLLPDPSGAFGSMIADLKTCNDAEPRAWEKHVFTYGYHVQAALYIDITNAVTGREYSQFAHIVQESSPPYEVARRLLSEEFIKLGRMTYISALKAYCGYMKRGYWPGYDDMEGTFDGWRISDPQPWMITA